MADRASPPSRPDPSDTGPGHDPQSDTAGIDPDDTEVVPAAFMGLVTSARATYRALRANSCYPAILAVGAVEDTVATLARINGRLEGYVGDYSDRGGKAVVRASELLGQARTALSDARHHLALDEATEPDLTPPDVMAVVA